MSHQFVSRSSSASSLRSRSDREKDRDPNKRNLTSSKKSDQKEKVTNAGSNDEIKSEKLDADDAFWPDDPVEKAQMQRNIKTLSDLHGNVIPECGEQHFVLANIRVNQIDEFNTAERSCMFDFSINLFWQDKDIVGKMYADWSLDDCTFKPFEISVSHGIEFEDFGEGTKWIRSAYSKHGIANFYKRFKTVVRLPLNFKRFPFDEHILSVKLYMKNEISEYAKFVVYDEDPDDQWLKSCWQKFHLDEWYFGTQPTLEAVDAEELEGSNYSSLTFSISVARKTHYYVWNVIWLMYFLNVITWCTFAITPDVLNDRLAVTITIFLSELAFNIVMSDILPRVAYNTLLSLYFLLNYFTLAVQSLEHVASFLLWERLGDEGYVARVMDWCCIGAYFIFHNSLQVTALVLSRRHNNKHKRAIKAESEENAKLAQNVKARIGDDLKKEK